eukprot:GDKH01008228.1.p1 GENE.GDKH01008228.1~~GDKH01008228.1.p1  ORF type:complete len:223 (+),score=13.61 GDKH01008228.1:121-789(+)
MCDFSVGAVELSFAERPDQSHAMGTGVRIWPASMGLARYLEQSRRKLPLKGARVLELGAGLGLVGLSCAALGASNVCFTDIDAVLPLLRQNLQLNEGKFDGTRLVIRRLDWLEDRDHIHAALELEPDSPQYDFIVGADVCFRDDLIRPLFDCIRAVATARTRIFLAFERRCDVTYKRFLDEAADDFSCKQVFLSPSSRLDEAEGAELSPVVMFALRRKRVDA